MTKWIATDIVEHVMPMIEQTYKVSRQPEDRATAGLSMGGGQTITSPWKGRSCSVTWR